MLVEPEYLEKKEDIFQEPQQFLFKAIQFGIRTDLMNHQPQQPANLNFGSKESLLNQMANFIPISNMVITDENTIPSCAGLNIIDSKSIVVPEGELKTEHDQQVLGLPFFKKSWEVLSRSESMAMKCDSKTLTILDSESLDDAYAHQKFEILFNTKIEEALKQNNIDIIKEANEEKQKSILPTLRSFSNEFTLGSCSQKKEILERNHEDLVELVERVLFATVNIVENPFNLPFSLDKQWPKHPSNFQFGKPSARFQPPISSSKVVFD